MNYKRFIYLQTLLFVVALFIMGIILESPQSAIGVVFYMTLFFLFPFMLIELVYQWMFKDMFNWLLARKTKLKGLVLFFMVLPSLVGVTLLMDTRPRIEGFLIVIACNLLAFSIDQIFLKQKTTRARI